MRQHPLSAAFPSIPAAELSSLIADIAQHGQREPGTLYEGMVLDGWHRFQACEKAGIQFRAVELDGDDPQSFVLSRNLHRRHLTASQRAEAVVACSAWKPARRPDKAAPGAGLSEAQMAKVADVGERTIRQAKVAHKAGLGGAITEGRVSAKRAAEIAKLPEPLRKAAIEQPPRAPTVQRPKIADGCADLRTELETAREALKDLGETARDLENKLSAYENTEPDEQQAEILRLHKRVAKLEGEIERQAILLNDAKHKNNELIREVKRLQRRNGSVE
jgi:hypothetical protein